MTHPHRDLIVALLDDPTLEVEHVWNSDVTKSSLIRVFADDVGDCVFRLREKPKPDVVIDYAIELSDHAANDPQGTRLNFWTTRKPNCRFTFTADGVFKSVEVIK